MDLEEIKRGLRAEIKKRENEQYATFQCNVRQMCKDVLAKLEEQESAIAELKKRSQWHRQKDKDIYFACGKHWGAEYIIKMKDGTTHLAYGGCDEGGDGSVSTYLHFQDEDYEWEYDDIDIWYEIHDPKIDGNIMEADK